MRRRDFITLIGGAAAWPLAARAQQAGERVRRIGVLMNFADDPAAQARLAAFRESLQKLGWRLDANLQIDYRWDVSSPERAQTAAAEILSLAPDVILANGTNALRAIQQATRTVPVVFTTVIEPIGQGFVANLAHPGGNITGFSYLEASVGGKWLNVLKDIAPQVTRVACMFNPQRGPYSVAISYFAQEAAQRLAVQYAAAPIFEPREIEPVVTNLVRDGAGGLIVSPDAFTVTHRDLIIELAARYKLSAVYSERIFVTAGGLVSYGADYVDHFRQAGSYVARILRGEKAGDLPVQQPSKFQLIVNVKTAKALRLEVPARVLAIADEVIE
jgi:putative tryptophan/tyrosine transport system substrate-binding protein